MSRTLNVLPGKSRAGIISYSSLPSTVLEFTEYGPSFTFDKVVDSLPYLGGTRRMDLALEAAIKELNKGRRSVPKIVLLLTGGRQESGAKPLSQFVQPLRDLGARAYVVVIGSDVAVNELIPLVESTEDVFSVSSFDLLQSHVRPISNQIIEPPGN